MKKHVFSINSDGFNGVWYPAPVKSSRGIIIMLGDSSEDRMARTGAKWLHEQGIHVMAMSADKKDNVWYDINILSSRSGKQYVRTE